MDADDLEREAEEDRQARAWIRAGQAKVDEIIALSADLSVDEIAVRLEDVRYIWYPHALPGIAADIKAGIRPLLLL